jgi:hypothetical protein
MRLCNCDRQGCHTARGQLIHYERLMREYRCVCGCSLIQKPVIDNFVVVGYTIHCPDCGQIDAVIHYNADFENAMAADEVSANLPPEFQALLENQKKPIDLDSIIETLF